MNLTERRIWKVRRERASSSSFFLKKGRDRVRVVVWGIIFLIKAYPECRRQWVLSKIKAHSECRRQWVLSRNEINARACANKRRYNRNWCTSDSLGVQQWGWLLWKPTLIPFMTREDPSEWAGSTRASLELQGRRPVRLRKMEVDQLLGNRMYFPHSLNGRLSKGGERVFTTSQKH